MRVIKIIALQLIVMLIISAGAFAQKSFEGIADIKYTGDRGDNTIKYFTKSGMIRIEMGENAKVDNRSPKTGTLIVKDKKLFMLMPERKTYVERPLDISSHLKKFEKKDNPGQNLTKTGQTKDILGHKAEQWTMKNDKGEVEVWSTNELGNFAMVKELGGLGSQDMPQWQQELLSKGFFPLLVIQHGTDGKEINRLEVTNIDKKTLDNSLFEVPAGYQRLDMQHGNMHNDSNKGK